MAKEKVDLRAALEAYKEKFNLIQKIPCSREENKAYSQMLKNGQPLPQNVEKDEDSFAYGNEEFYTVYKPDLSEKELSEYLTYKKLSMLNTIKNCALFFTVLTIIGLVGWFLIFWGAL